MISKINPDGIHRGFFYYLFYLMFSYKSLTLLHLLNLRIDHRFEGVNVQLTFIVLRSSSEPGK